MIENCIEQVLLKDFKDYEFLPLHFPISKTFGISIEPLGIEPPHLTGSKYDNVNEELKFFAEMLGQNFRAIVEQFNELYIFAKPELIYYPPFNLNAGRLGLKINMLEREDYESRIKKSD